LPKEKKEEIKESAEEIVDSFAEIAEDIPIKRKPTTNKTL